MSNFTDHCISSYTPTLTTLIRARRHASSTHGGKKKSFVAIGQAKAIGESELVSVCPELATLVSMSMVPLASNIPKHPYPESLKSSRRTDAFTLHVTVFKPPKSDSGFALHDGCSAVQRTIQHELENPQLAYFRSCHATVGGENVDKVPSYVADAIRWISSCHRDDMGMDDGHTDEIASMFYKHMVQAVKSGQLDYTRAAFALHETMKSGDMPFDQRILYIHLGAYVLACFLALHCLLFIMYGRPYRHCTACKLSEIRQPYLILYDLASSTNQHVYRQLLHTSAERQAPSLLPSCAI